MWNEIKEKLLGESGRMNIRSIKYFSTTGLDMPNGVNIQRGGFLTECRKNERAFVTEGIAGQQYGLADYRGGIIVFATSVNSVELSKNAIVNKAKQLWHSFVNMAMKDKKLGKCIDAYNKDDTNKDDLISAFSVGNAFKGKYKDIETGAEFSDLSYTIEVGGLSSKGLLNLAERIANEFEQQTVLVKDFNNMKFYLADGTSSDEKPDFSKINTKSIMS